MNWLEALMKRLRKTLRSVVFILPFLATRSKPVLCKNVIPFVFIGLTSALTFQGCSGPIRTTIDEAFDDDPSGQWQVIQDTKREPDWSHRDGAFHQTKDLGFVPQDNAFDGIARVGSHAVLKRFATPNDFVLELDITVASDSGDDCGVIWNYKDADNYVRLSTSPRNGFTLLQEKSSAQWKTLAKNARGAVINQPTRFRIEKIGPTVSVFQDAKSVFATRDSSIEQGTLALYAANHCIFDNLKLDQADATPRVTILQPAAFSVSSTLTLEVITATLNAPGGADVSVFVRDTPCSKQQASSADDATNRFLCNLSDPGTFDLEARLRNKDTVLATQIREHVTTGGVNIVSLGDSNTEGSGDRYSADGTSSSGRRRSTQGWQASLEDHLAQSGIQSVIFNTGIAGEQSQWLNSRLSGYIDQHRDADWALLMIGTNDVINIPWIRQDGCIGSGCEGTYAQTLQEIINKLTEAGLRVWLAKPPPLFGDPDSGLYANPELHQNNQHIRSYAAIAAQQVSGYEPGPDFYRFFLGEQNRAYLFNDAYHPNGLGSRIVAALWRNVLLDQEMPLPYVPDDFSVRLDDTSEPLYPHGYELDFLEQGDQIFIDSDIEITTLRFEVDRRLPTSRFRAVLERSLYPSAYGRIIEGDTLSLMFHNQLTRRFEFRFVASGADLEPEDSADIEDERTFYSIAPELVWSVTRTVSAHLRYSYTWVEREEERQLGFDAASGHGVSLAVEYHPLQRY